MNKVKITNYIIDTINLFVGITAIAISIYYSFKWFSYIGTPFVLALFLAIIYILFVNLIFEAAIGLFNQCKTIYKNSLKIKEDNKLILKKAKTMIFYRKLSGVLILVCWFLLTIFSMISTVAGQYNQFVFIEENQNSDKKDQNYYKNQIKNIDEQSTIIKMENKILEQELEILHKRNSSINSMEDRYKYKNTTRATEQRIDVLRGKIKENNAKLSGLLRQQLELEKQDFSDFRVSNGNVFSYLSKLTKIDPFYVQFILSLFPSIFIDVISPVSLAIFLYRKRSF